MLSNALDIVRNNISKMGKERTLDWFITLSSPEQKNVIKIMLLDYYKLYFSLELKSPDIIDDDIERTIEDILYNPSLIYKLIKATILFNNFDFLNKSLILNTMNEFNQDSELYQISPLHLLDKMTYKIEDTLASYEEYYLDYIKKNNHITSKRKIITEFLSNRLFELKKHDYNKYEMYILECIKEYYKWKIFIKNHDGEYLLNIEDFKYIEIIEKLDFEKILNEVENDYEFMNTILGEYLHYKTSKLEIKEDIVDTYLNENINLKIKQKLKINIK